MVLVVHADFRDVQLFKARSFSSAKCVLHCSLLASVVVQALPSNQKSNNQNTFLLPPVAARLFSKPRGLKSEISQAILASLMTETE